MEKKIKVMSPESGLVASNAGLNIRQNKKRSWRLVGHYVRIARRKGYGQRNCIGRAKHGA